MSAQDTAAILLLARHLDVEEPSPGQSKWTDIKAAIDGVSDDRLDASIRYFGQAGSPITARAAEMLTDLMMARMVRLWGVSRSERQ